MNAASWSRFPEFMPQKSGYYLVWDEGNRRPRVVWFDHNAGEFNSTRAVFFTAWDTIERPEWGECHPDEV